MRIGAARERLDLDSGADNLRLRPAPVVERGGPDFLSNRAEQIAEPAALLEQRGRGIESTGRQSGGEQTGTRGVPGVEWFDHRAEADPHTAGQRSGNA